MLALSLRQAGLGREQGAPHLTAGDGPGGATCQGPPAGVGLESEAMSTMVSVPTSIQEA